MVAAERALGGDRGRMGRVLRGAVFLLVVWAETSAQATILLWNTGDGDLVNVIFSDGPGTGGSPIPEPGTVVLLMGGLALPSAGRCLRA